MVAPLTLELGQRGRHSAKSDIGKGAALVGAQPVFRLFVSSTFADMQAERDTLAEHVFPFLEEYCRTRGARFQAVDLRSGISREAGADQLTMQICLDEVRRCQRLTPRPNFIALLGDRYGWQPLPTEIDAGEFETILGQLSSAEAELARQWYPLDTNSRPPGNVLRGRQDMSIGDAAWADTENQLHRSLSRSALKSFRAGDLRLAKYLFSATEHEIQQGALNSFSSERNVFAYLRTVAGPVPDEVAKIHFDWRNGARDKGLWRRQRELKGKVARRVKARDTLTHHLSLGDLTSGAHLPQLARRVREHLQRVIDEELQSRTRLSPQRMEIEAHQRFAEDRREHFVGRREILDRIGAYLADASDTPLILWGVPGCGKSALMAAASKIAVTSTLQVVARFIGATPASTQVAELLTSLCHEIRGLGDVASNQLRLDPRHLPLAFSNALATPRRHKAIVFLDGVDQLDREGPLRGLGWIPRKLPAGAKLIISVMAVDEGATSALGALRSIFPAAQFVRLGPLPEDEGARLLTQWLAAAGSNAGDSGVGRSLTDAQWKHVLLRFQASGGSPLFLRLAADEVKRWRSFSGIPRQASGRIGLADSVRGLIADLFDRLSEARHHGPVLTRYALGLLAAARHGLTETEMLSALSNREVLADFHTRWPHSPTVARVPHSRSQAHRLPDLVWSRLYADLEPYLHSLTVDGVEVMAFFHRQFRDAATEAFLAVADGSRLHRRLAACFMAQPHDVGEDGRALPSMRKLGELPFQLARCGLAASSLARLLGDITFLEAKCATGGIFDLMRDIERAQASCSDEQTVRVGFQELRQLLRSCAREIGARPELALQSLHNVARWAAAADKWRDRWIERARARLDRRGPWLAVEAPLPDSGRPVDVSFEDEAPVQAVSRDCAWLASQLDNQTVAVHEITSGEVADVRAVPVSRARHLSALAIENGGGRLAWLTDATADCELSDQAQRARNGEKIICWLPSGELVFVRADGVLVAWDVELREVKELILDLPAPLVALDDSADGNALLVIAGERRESQQAHLIWRRLDHWEARQIPYDGPPIIDARLGQNSSEALIACQDVSLKILQLETGMIVREMFYERHASTLVRGPPVKCALVGFGRELRAFVATRYGDIAVWVPSEKRLTALTPYGHRLDSGRIVVLKSRPRDGRVLLTTRREAYFLDETAATTPPPSHAAEVDDCCLLSGGHVASVSRQDKTIRWWTAERLERIDAQNLPPSWAPLTVCADAAGDHVLVGLENGTVDIMAPHGLGAELGRQLFRSPVVGLVPDVHTAGVAGSAGGGLCRFNLQDPSQNRLLRHESERGELKQMAPGTGRCWFWALDVKSTGWGNESRVCWYDDDAQEHVAWRGGELVRRFAVSPDGATLAIANGSNVRTLVPRWFGWRNLSKRAEIVRLLAFLGDGAWLAVAKEDSSWIEIWRNEYNLPAVASLNLGREPWSMAVLDDRIIIGCRTGEVVSLRFKAGGIA